MIELNIHFQLKSILNIDRKIMQNKIVDILQSSGITGTQGYVSRLLKKWELHEKD